MFRVARRTLRNTAKHHVVVGGVCHEQDDNCAIDHVDHNILIIYLG